MLNSKPVDKLVFLDVEATSQYRTFDEMPEKLKELFRKRFKIEFDKIDPNWGQEKSLQYIENLYNAKAPLHPEWAKIICISVGRFVSPITAGGDLEFKTKAFIGEEKEILASFHKALKPILDVTFNHPEHLVAHAGMIYDFPMIAKRMILNRMPLPPALDYSDRKPWDLAYLVDTATTWKYGQFDGGAALDMLAYQFDIASSKTTMDGSMVKDEFWEKGNIAGIAHYCNLDVFVLAQVYLRLKNLNNKVIMTSEN